MSYYDIELGSRFKKELEKMIRRGKDPEKLKAIVRMLANKDPLPLRCVDHPLIGKFQDCRDCHIEPGWILIYLLDKKERKLILVRTVSHSDLSL